MKGIHCYIDTDIWALPLCVCKGRAVSVFEGGEQIETTYHIVFLCFNLHLTFGKVIEK